LFTLAFDFFHGKREETETAARMLLLPRMTGGGGFIGDIPRGGLGEEAATLDRLLAVSGIRFSPSPICGSFIVSMGR
jgi:hypothetical protein